MKSQLSEYGIVPIDWDLISLGQLFKLSSGTGLTKSSIGARGMYPVYGGNGISFYHSEFTHTDPQIIIGRVGAYCGCIHITRPNSWITDNALFIEEKLSKFDDKFIYFLLTFLNLNQHANKNAQPVISGQKIYPIKIGLPSLPEQQKIADILSTVDEKIEVIEAQIAETEQLKKGLMQRLLTKGIGHTKFKDSELGEIPEEWGVTPLGSIGSFSKGSGITKSDLVQSDGLPCIRYGEIYTVHHYVIKNFYSFIPKSVALESTLIKKGDVLFAGSGETVEEIGKAVAYVGEEEAYAGGDIIIYSSGNFDNIYLSYVLNSPIVTTQRRKFGQGNSVVHIYSRDVAKLQVPVPSLKEQARIANILSTVDAKIEILEKRKNEMDVVKKGLMQKLLTGKIRVKTSEKEMVS